MNLNFRFPFSSFFEIQNHKIIKRTKINSFFFFFFSQKEMRSSNEAIARAASIFMLLVNLLGGYGMIILCFKNRDLEFQVLTRCCCCCYHEKELVYFFS